MLPYIKYIGRFNNRFAITNLEQTWARDENQARCDVMVLHQYYEKFCMADHRVSITQLCKYTMVEISI